MGGGSGCIKAMNISRSNNFHEIDFMKLKVGVIKSILPGGDKQTRTLNQRAMD